MLHVSRRSFLQGSLALGAGACLGRIASAAAGLEVIGRLRARPSADIAASPLGVGFETLDRKMFDPEPCYPYMARLGAKWARCQTGWGRCEPRKGEYDFAWLDQIVDRLRSIGIQPWFNLGYGNRLYTPEAPDDFAVGWVPLWDEQALAAWLRFVRALAGHFADRVKHWEIWNEPNIRNFWKPHKSDPAEYVKFVAITAPVVRQAVPGAQILGPAVWGMEYFTECFERGLGRLIDKVSYHWYRPSPEDRYETSMAACREVLARHNLDLPLWQGESGCPSQQGGAGGMAKYPWNEALQARWVARRTLIDLRLRVEMTSYFQTCDMLYPNEDGSPGGRLNSKGLIRRSDYKPKPAYFVYQCLCALFDAQTEWADRPIEITAADGQPLDPSALLQASFVRHERPLHAYWLPTDMRQDHPPRTVDLVIPHTGGAALNTPVLIDPLTAQAHRLPRAERRPGQWRIPQVPLADTPLIIADQSHLDLATP